MLSNRFRIPAPWPQIIESGGHEPNPSRYSVTDLLGPPLVRTLKIKHYGDLSSDVSDYLWCLNGTALDNMFSAELAKQPGWITQHKMELEIEGVTVVGVADAIKDDLIIDLKATSVYTLNNHERLDEYAKQLNMYAYMRTRERETPIRRIQIHMFLRDWVAGKARWDPAYPKAQIHVEDMTSKLLKFDASEAYIYERLLDHLNNPMRPCTPAERWQKPTTWAVMKKGRKSALRVLESEKGACDWVDKTKPPGDITVVERPGSCPRCQDYCSVSSKCPFKEDLNV